MEELSTTAKFTCPFCGSKRIRRSHRHVFVDRVFLPFLKRRPFRCMDCSKRFYSPKSTDSPKPTDPRPARLAAVMSDPPRVKPPQDQPSPKPNVPVILSTVERRGFSRVPCQIPARIVAGSGTSMTGVLTDVSLKGCFVETRDSIPVGNEIELSLTVKEGPQSRALVRRSLPARGIGIEFTFMTAPNFRRLQRIARNSVRLNVRP
jgi:DNA-directed RNA polymerase subunit RPC12/RpoP